MILQTAVGTAESVVINRFHEDYGTFDIDVDYASVKWESCSITSMMDLSQLKTPSLDAYPFIFYCRWYESIADGESIVCYTQIRIAHDLANSRFQIYFKIWEYDGPSNTTDTIYIDDSVRFLFMENLCYNDPSANTLTFGIYLSVTNQFDARVGYFKELTTGANPNPGSCNNVELSVSCYDLEPCSLIFGPDVLHGTESETLMTDVIYHKVHPLNLEDLGTGDFGFAEEDPWPHSTTGNIIARRNDKPFDSIPQTYLNAQLYAQAYSIGFEMGLSTDTEDADGKLWARIKYLVTQVTIVVANVATLITNIATLIANLGTGANARTFIESIIGNIADTIHTESPGDKEYVGNIIQWLRDVFIWPLLSEIDAIKVFNFDEV